MNLIMNPGCIAYLFLSLGNPMTLKFDHPIEFISMGNKTKIESQISDNRKILVLKPDDEFKNSNLVVVTSKGDFQFKKSVSKRSYPSFYSVSLAKKDHHFEKVKSTRDFDLFEGKYSVKIVNKSKDLLSINSIKTKKDYLACKGSPLFINLKEQIW